MLVTLCMVAGAFAASGHGGFPAVNWQTRALATPDAGCRTPGEVLDLANWKLQAAGLEPGDNSGKLTEVKGPALASTVLASVFEVTPECSAVVFSAGVDGVTTKGSSYPRSELREMTGGGESEAAWSSTSGVHTLTVTEAFTHLPNGKPHLVGAQIHDAKDDVSVFRLEGAKLYVTDGDDANAHLVDPNYVLGTPFEAKYVVSDGQVRAYYNGALKATMTKSFSGAYFKVGAYTQANCTNSPPCAFDNYGQVAVLSLLVSHDDAARG
jgi:hypothetical protein